jgi:hypothetical protein
MNGFGGGGKIILPGITSFETTRDNHISFYKVAGERREKRITGMGIFDDNPMRIDIEEAAELAGIDMVVNCLMNAWGETTAVFAGALKPGYAAAVEAAKEHYLTPTVTGKDVAIANTYTKANEGFIGAAAAYRALGEGGDAVLIANAPDGQVTHYLLGTFGNSTFTDLRQPSRIPGHVGRLIVFTEYPDLAAQSWFGESDKVTFVHKWEDVLGLLKERGAGTSVAVFPSAEIQYFQ